MLALNQDRGLLQMLLTYARAFVVLTASIEFNRGQINGQMLLGEIDLITDQTPLGQATLSSLQLLIDLCSGIPSLNPVVDQITHAADKIRAGVFPLILHNELEILQRRIMDELKRHFYYPVNEAYAAIYANPAPWGEEVHNNFPSAHLDVCNAGKCVILGQGTACVFHLMRVMEVGLKVLGREAGIPYAPSWESYFSQLEIKMKAKHASKARSWRKKEPLLKELIGDLSMIKIAWRNPTMHIVREYSPGEAEQVYNAVRTFMQRMAEHGMKEKGRPVAITVALAATA